MAAVSDQYLRVDGDMVRNGQQLPTVEQSNYKMPQWREVTVDEASSKSSNAPISDREDSAARPNNMSSIGSNGLADFFSPEVFQIVLHNPTTAHRLLKFSQSRLCGENMEFLEKVDKYNSLLDDLTNVLSDIHRSFTAPEAPRQLNISSTNKKQISTDIKALTLTTLPSMEMIFAEAQEYVEEVLATEIYPRFVKFQMTKSAMLALSGDRKKYQGLGDCFCLTSPAKADNPIVFASDGFVSVTGYTRKEIVPRNCRFLQGNYTDPSATRRLKLSIEAREESVELLLNYRKTGEPFWNLLYVAPLFNAAGKVVFFLGGQINCSTTIRSCSDILRVLSMSDDSEEEKPNDVAIPVIQSNARPRRNFFKAFRKDTNNKVEIREAGMERGLLSKIENMDFKKQMQMFYTAYSKYLVINYDNMCIQFYSTGILNVLSSTSSPDFIGMDIFKFLSEHTTKLSGEFKNKVKDSLKLGQAISASISLFTLRSLARRTDDKFFTHWTPLKDEHSRVRWVVLTLSSTMYD